MTNPQYGNAGNVGDILKHAGLCALADAVRDAVERPTPVHYVETHAFLLHALLPNPAAWRGEVEARRARWPAYGTYVQIERPWVERGRYRCSSGLVLGRVPAVRLHLAEKDPETRALLREQLTAEGVEPVQLVEDGRHHPDRVGQTTPGALLGLVDPFEAPDPFWPAVEGL
ncbi:MAG: hypothetical protein ACC662_11895, partial [Planctomycetota bacterium]